MLRQPYGLAADLPGAEDAPAVAQGRVRAAVPWGGRIYELDGRLSGDFIFENGEIHLRITDLSGAPDGLGSFSLWVSGRDITGPDGIILRSERWEVPAGADRDLVLRSLVHTLSDSFRTSGDGLELGRQFEGSLELLVRLEVPLDQGVEYLSTLLPLRQRCEARPALWHAPTEILRTRPFAEEERAAAAYHLSHLPGWLESRQLWSVFRWSPAQGRLFHMVQFSVPERFRRAVEQRFRLK